MITTDHVYNVYQINLYEKYHQIKVYLFAFDCICVYICYCNIERKAPHLNAGRSKTKKLTVMITTTSKVQKLFQKPNTDYTDIEVSSLFINLQVEWGDLFCEKYDLYELDDDFGYLLKEDRGAVVDLFIKILERNPEKISCRMGEGKQHTPAHIVELIESIPFKSIKWA